MLIRHFRDPSLYAWVVLEAQDPLIKSLDDVVAMREDGGVDYGQVKFTVNADQYPLDWEWLLASKARGTSMLANGPQLCAGREPMVRSPALSCGPIAALPRTSRPASRAAGAAGGSSARVRPGSPFARRYRAGAHYPLP